MSSPVSITLPFRTGSISPLLTSFGNKRTAMIIACKNTTMLHRSHVQRASEPDFELRITYVLSCSSLSAVYGVSPESVMFESVSSFVSSSYFDWYRGSRGDWLSSRAEGILEGIADGSKNGTEIKIDFCKLSSSIQDFVLAEIELNDAQSHCSSQRQRKAVEWIPNNCRPHNYASEFPMNLLPHKALAF